MKIKILAAAGLALFLAAVVNLSTFAQSPQGQKGKDKGQKGQQVENTGKTESVEPQGKLPPGQAGKAVTDDKVQGYEKTGDKGQKEGWNKEAGDPGRQKMSKEEKATQKALKKEEKNRAREARRLEKEKQQQGGEKKEKPEKPQ